MLATFQKAAESDPLLVRLCSVYGLYRLEADLAWFLENGYLAPATSRAIRKELNLALAALRPDALTLVEAFGIPAPCLGPLADFGYLVRTGLVVENTVESA